MKKSLLGYFLSPWYALSAVITVVMVAGVVFISSNMPQPEATNFLSPMVNRFDFLNIEDVSLDAIFSIKDTKPIDHRVIVVNVEEVGPTPDGKIALLLYKLQNYGVRVIGLDVIFDSLHFDRFTGERAGEPLMLKQALADVPNVVVVNGFSEETMEPSLKLDPDVQAAVKHQGFANLLPDGDDVVRRFRPWVTVGGERWEALPVHMVEIYDPTLIAGIMQLPEEPQIIYYTSTYTEIDNIRISDIVEADSALDALYADRFRDAIVLVGYVNEGGVIYTGDTHRTPLASRTVLSHPDGPETMGVDGPDMSGVLIHANVINMLLTGEFVYGVPAWVDWLLVFLLAYINIAFYRVIRGKPVTEAKHGWLVAILLLVESPVVFLLPIIAYFSLDVKISYHLMATSVLLFIPGDIWGGKLRALWEVHRVKRVLGQAAAVRDDVIAATTEDSDALGTLSMLHTSLRVAQLTLAINAVRAEAAGAALPEGMDHPDLAQFEALVPEAARVLQAQDARDRGLDMFLRYVFGRRESLMRTSAIKDRLTSLIRDDVNAYAYTDEYELLKRYFIDAFDTVNHRCRETALFVRVPRAEGGLSTIVLQGKAEVDAVDPSSIPTAGVHAVADGQCLSLSPFVEWAECKLHRQHELFIFNGRVPQQYGLERSPMYLGPTLACDPALSLECLAQLRNIFGNECVG